MPVSKSARRIEAGYAPPVSMVMMTPKRAEELLESNQNNRAVRVHYVKFLAEQILRGQWELTTDAIGIRQDGRLANGQHRLSAIVLAGKTDPEIVCPILLAMDITDSAFRVLDVGVKRTAGDALGISSLLSADATLIGFILGHGFMRRVPMDVVTEIVRWWDEPHNILYSTSASSAKGVGNAAVRVGAGVRLVAEADPAKNQYVLTQYKALQTGDVTAMSRATASLWKRMVEKGKGFYGNTEVRISHALFTYKVLDPNNKDSAPKFVIREELLNEVRGHLLRLGGDKIGAGSKRSGASLEKVRGHKANRNALDGQIGLTP
jgi:hypothetical protein